MTGIIILAAGSSSRMGTAKQALNYQGQTLLQRSVQIALASDCETAAVVLGANAEALRPTIINQPVQIFFNEDWEEGMASSIRCGITELQKVAPQLTAIVLMLCDQPFVDISIINQLINNALSGKIIASAYNETIGPPVLFDRVFFSELVSLSGHEGAKKIMLAHPEAVIQIPFPLGAVDIDTIADYDRLNS
jgi:molybdenum cofactor cytidylyltransferase